MMFRVIHGLNQVCIFQDKLELVCPSWRLSGTWVCRIYQRHMNLSHRMCVNWFTTTYCIYWWRCCPHLSLHLFDIASCFRKRRQSPNWYFHLQSSDWPASCFTKKLDPNAETEAGGLTTKSELSWRLSKNQNPKYLQQKTGKRPTTKQEWSKSGTRNSMKESDGKFR